MSSMPCPPKHITQVVFIDTWQNDIHIVLQTSVFRIVELKTCLGACQNTFHQEELLSFQIVNELERTCFAPDFLDGLDNALLV